MTWSATRQVVGDRWPLIPATYYPHLTIGYGTAEAHRADRQALKAVLADIPQGEVRLRAAGLSLVSIDHGGTDLRLAAVAPSLGISPVPVASARWYEGVTGLQAVEQPV